MNRTGAALVISLVILAALLLLGLPFLFTQSSSLSGTRSFAHVQQAHIGRDAAENFAIGAASDAIAQHLAQGAVDDWSSLYWELDGNTQSAAHLLGPDRVGIDLSVPWNPSVATSLIANQAGTRNVVLGIAIEDEAGKLDPNHLDAVSWATLLGQVKIADWNGDPTVPGNQPGNGGLARGLAKLRYDLGGRITALEQLLSAVPVGANARQHLTRAELDQLRPYLTLATRGQARSGLVDLGTVLTVSGTGAQIDSVAPGNQLSFAVTPALAGNGTTLVTADAAGATHPFAANAIDNSGALVVDRPIAVEAPPDVNVHQATPVVRAVVQAISAPKAPTAATIPIPSTLTGATGLPALDTLASPGPPAVNAAPASPDALFQNLSHVALLNPLATYVALGTTLPQASQINDIGGAGATDANGIAIDSPTSMPPRPVLSETATVIHIQGGPLANLPTSGYGHLVGTDINGNPVSEYIFYGSSNLPTTAAPAMLWSVTRHLGMPPGSPPTTAARLLIAGLTLTIIAPHELPPLAIASHGVVTIDGAASVNDAVADSPDTVGHHSAQQARRIVVQALPQEQILEARWQKQSQLHALIAARNGSQLTSFPVPYPRLSDVFPIDGPAGGGTLDQEVGLRPATLRTLISVPSAVAPHDWWLAFSGSSGDFLKSRSANAAIRSDPAVKQSLDHLTAGVPDFLTPEGLMLNRLGSANYLAYAVSPTDPGLFMLSSNPGSIPAVELPPRQLALWVKPSAIINGLQVLAEIRGPTTNAGSTFSAPDPTQTMDQRGNGSNSLQNSVRLAYDGANQQLVLTLNNGAIEFAPAGIVAPTSPREHFLVPNLDPQTLGSNETATTANDASSVNSLAALQPLHQLETRYQIGTPGGTGLTPGVWHQVQVAYTDNAPGAVALMVDGLVGHEVTRLNNLNDPVQPTRAGDHFALGALVLKTDLPGPTTVPSADVKTQGANALLVDSIDLDGCLPGATGAAAIAGTLPARGMVRIGNEYISYESISGTTLRNCVRARRQNTDLYNATDALRYPVLEAHFKGDAVVPGGYRFVPASGRLYRGGCSLKYALPVGNLTTNYAVTVHYQIPSMVGIPAGSTAINLTPGDPLLAQLPPRGYVLINSTQEVLYYQNTGEVAPRDMGAMPALQNLGHVVIPAWTATTPGTNSAIPDPTPVNTLTLISIEVAGADPTEDGRYVQPPADCMFQVYDPSGSGATAGRCEWIAYTRTAKDADGHGFFIDDSFGPGYPNSGQPGFSFQQTLHGRPLDSSGTHRGPSSRGQERTGFFPADQYPAGSRIIPVQTQIPQAWILASGDVVTLAPKQLGATAAHRAWQACIRYAATDGYLTTADPNTGLFIDHQIGTGCDTHNEYFAFTEALPDPVPPETAVWDSGSVPFEMLSWPCWSGRDLSPESPIPDNNTVLKPYLMPWVNAFATNFLIGGDDRMVFIGRDDDRADRNGSASTALAATVDAIQGGVQPAASAANQPNRTQILGVGSITQTAVDGVVWIPGTTMADIANVTVNASAGVFNPTANTSPGYGLALIGGEVFAYRQHALLTPPGSYSASQADLIGRGLLGSVPLVHSGREPVVVLPIGPVAPLGAALPQTYKNGAPFPLIDAPAVMISSADGSQMELLAAPGGQIAPWLRGLYDTTPIDWSYDATAPPLAIGWWPRYPSALPHAPFADPVVEAAALRSRTYAWAGFPLRFYDSTFLQRDPLGEVALSDDAGIVDVRARAMATGFDWGATGIAGSEVPLRNASVSFISAAFNHDQFTAGGAPVPVDGAELRVFWRYHNAALSPTPIDTADFLTSLADSANRAPTIGSAILRCRAPAKILAVESAR